MSESGAWPRGVCSKGVATNSLHSTLSTKWVQCSFSVSALS